MVEWIILSSTLLLNIMKKAYRYLFPLLSLLPLISMEAQQYPTPFEVIDRARLKVEYHFEMKKKTLGRTVMPDTMVVLSGDRWQLSYMKSTYRADSVKNDTDGETKVFEYFKRGMKAKDALLFLEPHTLPSYVYADKREGEYIVIQNDYFFVPTLYREPIEGIVWKIRDYDSRVIAGHITYKAVCDYRGRRYEAWYTKDIPSDVGPWKFHGLPGLIIEIYDEDRDFVWTAYNVSLRDKEDRVCPIRWLQFSDKPFTEVSRRQLLKDYYDYLSGSPIAENRTIQQILKSGVRDHYRQKEPKTVTEPFLEVDFKADEKADSSTTDHEIRPSIDSLYVIPGKPSEKHLLVEYRYTHIKDTLENSSFTPDLMLLQVSPEETAFYSYRTYVMKSRFGTSAGHKEWQSLFKRGIAKVNAGGSMKEFMNQLPRMGDTEIIIQGAGEETMKVYDSVGKEQYVYRDNPELSWGLEDGSRKILDYTCFKATTDFRGRKWIAWYAPDIPQSLGPWKLSGLPGLICEVYDEKERYHYVITGLEQKAADLDYHILISEDAESVSRNKLINSKEVYANAGGELSLLGGANVSNNRPKSKELR